MRNSHALGVFICSAAVAGGALAASAAVLGPERCIFGKAPLELVHLAPAEQVWPAEGVDRIRIDAAGGSVQILGTDGGPVRVVGAAPVTLDGGLMHIGHESEAGTAGETLIVEAPRQIAVSIRSESGEVECRGLAGGLEVQSLQGDVRLIDVSGSVAADVSAGDVAIRYAPAWSADSAVTCKTLDGAIDIALPADSSFDLSVDSLDGRVTSDFAGLVEGAPQAAAYRARIGAGGSPVAVDTLDGTVAIRRLTSQ